MSGVVFPSVARKAKTTSQVIYNGCYPDAETMTFLQEETNRIVAYRTKGWSFAAPLNAVPAAGGSRDRWRFFMHTGTHCKHVWIRVLAMPSNNAGSPSTTITFTLAGDPSPAATAGFSYGAETDSDTPSTISVGQVRPFSSSGFVDLTADTDYEVLISDADNARTLAVCVWEVALAHDTTNGYIANGVSAGSSVLDNQRADMTGVLRNAWLQNGAPLITWASDTDATAYSAAGETNLIDGSTSVTTATAGFTVDLRQRSTVRRASSGVPCRMRAYIQKTLGTGSVLLKDSSGTTLATVTSSGATADWFDSGVFYLPATLAKYDLYGKVVTGLGNTNVYAVSVYSADDT